MRLRENRRYLRGSYSGTGEKAETEQRGWGGRLRAATGRRKHQRGETELLNKLCEAEHVPRASPLTLPESGPQRLASALGGGSSGSHRALGTGRSLPRAAAPPHPPNLSPRFLHHRTLRLPSPRICPLCCATLCPSCPAPSLPTTSPRQM